MQLQVKIKESRENQSGGDISDFESHAKQITSNNELLGDITDVTLKAFKAFNDNNNEKDKIKDTYYSIILPFIPNHKDVEDKFTTAQGKQYYNNNEIGKEISIIDNYNQKLKVIEEKQKTEFKKRKNMNQKN